MKKIQKFLIVLTVVSAMIAVFSVNSFAWWVEDLTYTDENGNVYTYSYHTLDTHSDAYMVYIDKFEPAQSLTDVVIPTEIDGMPVYQINRQAFTYTDIKSVVIPEGIFIDSESFIGCPELERVDLYGDIAYSIYVDNKGNKTTEYAQFMFAYCPKLKEVNIYNGMDFIPAGMFEGCSSLEEFDFSNITTIYAMAFADCISLKVPDLSHVKYIYGDAFNGCEQIAEVTLNQNTVYGERVFSNCKNLKRVIIPDDMKYLKVNNHYYVGFDNLFLDSENIEYLYIGTSFNGQKFATQQNAYYNAVATLSFDGLKNLETIDVSKENENFFVSDGVLYYETEQKLMIMCYPDKLSAETYVAVSTDKIFELAPFAFSNTTYLKEVVFPQSVSSVANMYYTQRVSYYTGSYSFENSSVERITFLNGGLTSIREGMFKNSQIKEIDLSEASKVWDYAFEGCSNLMTADLTSCTQVGEGAFKDCTNLETIKVPNLTYIKNKAFENCQSIKKLNLSATQTILYDAFKGCSKLQFVNFSNRINSVYDGAFDECPKVTFFCEEDSAAYTYAIENDISVTSVNVSFYKNSDYQYTGNEIRPSMIVAFGETVLAENIDYIVTYSSNVEVGRAVATIRFIGIFEGLEDIERYYQITLRSVSTLIVEYVVDNEYSGEVVRPKVVVKNGDIVLTEGTDYTITYNNGTNAGSMFFTIKGLGNYTGTVDCYYNIIRRDITEATVSKNNDMVYTGEELTPSPIITWNGFTLVEGVDYEIRYFENVNSGYGTMVIYGMGNFCGTQRVQFRIFGKNIENAVISEISDQIYTGNEITPEISVTLDGAELKKDIDYTVKYENNIEKGTGAVVISGIGNYSGVAKQTFNINKNSVYSFTVFSETEMTETYDGTELKPEMEVYFGTELLTEGVDYTVSLENNVNAGTATVTIIGIGLYEGERSYDFTILPCEITENDISVSGNMEYNGMAVEPEISVFKNGTTLTEGKDYVVTYSNNNGIGVALVTIEGVGNYCDTVNLQYEIYSSQQDDENENQPPENVPDVNPDDKENTDSTDDKDNSNNIPNDMNQNVTDNKDNTEENKETTKNPVIPDTDSNESCNTYIICVMISMTCMFAVVVIDTKKKRRNN